MLQTRLSISNLALRHLGMKPIVDLTTVNPSQAAINDFWEPSRDDVFSEFRWPFATSIITLGLAPATITLPNWQVVYLYPQNPQNIARVWTVFGSIGQIQINPNDGSSNFISSVEMEELQEFEILFVPNPLTIAAWDSGTTYAIGDYAVLNSLPYIAIQAGTNKQPDVNPAYWLSSFEGLKVIGSNNQAAFARVTSIMEDFALWDAKFCMAFAFRMASNMAIGLTGDDDKALKMINIYNAFIGETKRSARVERIKKPEQVSVYQKARG